MRYTAATGPLADEGLDAIVVPVRSGGQVPPAVAAALGPRAGALQAAAGRFALDEPGAQAWVSVGGSGPDVLLLGLGPVADLEALQFAANVAGRTLDRRRVACLLPLAAADGALDGTPSRAGPDGAGAVVAENWVVGAYRFERYRPDPGRGASAEVIFWGSRPEDVDTGVIIGEAANATRDLVNTPGGDLTPLLLAEHCRELGSTHGWQVSVIEGQALIDGGFGGLLGVGAGSVHPPVLIEIERGALDEPHVALVGKGITFDAGGLSLKSTAQMLTMKADMTGAAGVLNAVAAAERLGVPTHVKAYLACAENLPSGTATRIGDVLRHRNGLTTEVIDADCEGRLVLGDALAYAAEFAPTSIIDIATLTSSTGLGPDMWAVLGTDPDLVGQLLAAGRAAGEPGWELPLWDRYAARLRSDVADLRNYDPTITAPFGAVLAAQYLRRFVGGRPWAHIDLALTVMRAADSPAWRSGSNGNGTRTLARHLLAAGRAGS